MFIYYVGDIIIMAVQITDCEDKQVSHFEANIVIDVMLKLNKPIEEIKQMVSDLNVYPCRCFEVGKIYESCVYGRLLKLEKE